MSEFSQQLKIVHVSTLQVKQEPTFSQDVSQVNAHSFYLSMNMIAVVLDFKGHRFATTSKGDMWLVNALVFVAAISNFTKNYKKMGNCILLLVGIKCWYACYLLIGGLLHTKTCNGSIH